jgi:hypothetical protein
MGRFLAFLFVFLLGGAVGFVVGGLGGSAIGGFVGACEVINSSVDRGVMTQDEANATVKSIADKIDVDPAQKEQIVESLKESEARSTPCQKAIEAL